MSEQVGEFSVTTQAMPEPDAFETRLAAVRLRRRRRRAWTVAGELGWLTLIVLLLTLLLAQFVSLNRG